MRELDNEVAMLTQDASAMKDLTIQEAVRLFKMMRDYRDEVEATIKLLTESIDDARSTVLPLMFNESNLTSITVDGYRFTISQSVRASIPAATKPDAYQWLRDNGRGDLIIATVNASTLAADVRKTMEDGNEYPEDLFKVALVPNVSITKA